MAWLTPTRRVVRWSPLVVALVLSASTIAALRLADRPLRSEELTMSSLVLVIGALCGLHDPGRDFLHALPVPASRRLIHRLVVIVPVLAVGLLVVRGLVSVWFVAVPASPGWEAMIAFGTVGVALCAVLTRRLGPRAVDAAVLTMVMWLVIALSSGGLDLPLYVAMPWWRWPLVVASLAGIVTVVATTSGVDA